MDLFYPDHIDATLILIFICAGLALVIYFGGMFLIRILNSRDEGRFLRKKTKVRRPDAPKPPKHVGLRRLFRRRNRANRRAARGAARDEKVITAGPYHG